MRGVRIACAVAVALAVPGTAPRLASGSERSWFVSATVGGPGDGTRAAPFDDLADVERASRPGDRIVVLAAPRSAAPLDGGVDLKAGQRLIGARGKGHRLASLTNTTDHLHGDAVRLADASVVRNLEISGTGRGGIYGRNVRGA